MNSLINEITLTGIINGSSELVGSIQSAQFLYGTINSVTPITGKISNGRVGELTGKLQQLGAISGKIQVATSNTPDIYNDSYVVTPRIHEQSLETKNKLMKENVSVLAIPYYETSNLSGRTVYIGGE